MTALIKTQQAIGENRLPRIRQDISAAYSNSHLLDAHSPRFGQSLGALARELEVAAAHVRQIQEEVNNANR